MTSLPRSLVVIALGTVLMFSPGCSNQQTDDDLPLIERYKIRNDARMKKWDERFERMSENADRRAEKRWDRLMN